MIVVKDPLETEGGSSSPIHTNSAFMQKVQQSLGLSASPAIFKRDLHANYNNNNNNHSPIMHSLKPPTHGMDSDFHLQRTRANSRSQTPFLSYGGSIQDRERDFISSYGGQSEIKSRANIEGTLEGESSLVLNETGSPVKTVMRRRSSPNVIEGPKFTLKEQTITEEEQKETNESFSKIHRKNTDFVLTTTERRDDSGVFLNQNTSYVNTTKVFVTNTRKGEIDLDTSVNQQKQENDEIMDLSIQIPKIRKIDSMTDEMSTSKKRWGKVSLLFRSLMQWNREEVKALDNAQGVLNEINNYNLRTWNNSNSQKKRDLAAQDFARDAFDLIRRVQAFCECATIGSFEHIQLMQKIIDDDPKKFMLETIDPSHLLNKKNSFGHTPMYIAAKNGNLEVIKLLVSKKANHTLTSTVVPTENTTESPLEAAVKWNHKAVVEFLLDNCEYSFNVLRRCVIGTNNLEMRQLLREHIRSRFRKKIAFLFCCFKG